MISFVALLSSIRISRRISALSASSSCELAMDKPSPLTCFRIVSSLALPNRFLDGRGDSAPPLFVVPLFCVPDCALELLPLNLCGNVLDFSHGRVWSLFVSAYKARRNECVNGFFFWAFYWLRTAEWRVWFFGFSVLTSGFFSAWARRLANVFAISSIIDAMPVDARPIQKYSFTFTFNYSHQHYWLWDSFSTFTLLFRLNFHFDFTHFCSFCRRVL